MAMVEDRTEEEILKEAEESMVATNALAQLIRDAFTVHGYKVSFIIKDLMEKHPDAVDAFLAENAESFLHRRITKEMMVVRRQIRHRLLVDKKEAADRFHADGNIDHLTIFDTPYDVGDSDIKLRLGDMTKDDVLFVAEHRGKLREAAEKEEKLMKHIAKQLQPGQKVEDIFNEEQMEDLYRLYKVTF